MKLGLILFSLIAVKCEPPAHRENVVISGYTFPALENAQISVSCLSGYGLPQPRGGH